YGQTTLLDDPSLELAEASKDHVEAQLLSIELNRCRCGAGLLSRGIGRDQVERPKGISQDEVDRELSRQVSLRGTDDDWNDEALASARLALIERLNVVDRRVGNSAAVGGDDPSSIDAPNAEVGVGDDTRRLLLESVRPTINHVS